MRALFALLLLAALPAGAQQGERAADRLLDDALAMVAEAEAGVGPAETLVLLRMARTRREILLREHGASAAA